VLFSFAGAGIGFFLYHLAPSIVYGIKTSYFGKLVYTFLNNK
jgi:hypothetical protein